MAVAGDGRMNETTWKVGELAERTGLSVRTLHYYDEIGLLPPSHRTGAGHRWYAARDVERLQRIKSLRQLGFPLEEIRDLLDRPEYAPRRVIQMHITRLREAIECQERLCGRLEAIATRMDGHESVTAEEFMQTIKEIEVMENVSQYYTPEQQKYLEERARIVGPERIREVEGEWKELIAQVRAEMEKGTDPAGESMQKLAARWKGLIEEFTGGDAGIADALGHVWRGEPGLHDRCGTGPDLFAYVGEAVKAGQKPK